MSRSEPVPESIARRAAAIARGPHPCPSCEAPTWAEPPVPWLGMRDYLVRCDACDRPINVHVDRELVVRREHAPRALLSQPGMVDPLDELLRTRDRAAVLRRLAIAAVGPLATATAASALGLPPAWLLAATLAAVVPSCMWLPVLAAIAWSRVGSLRTARAPRREAAAPVRVERGRWDQWLREERRRERERAQEPEAVLRELERVLDERELRRVRLLAERGEVPLAHLDDLLRYRRSWHATVA